jgi:hypothetical protein
MTTTQTAPIAAEEGTHFEIHKHNDYNEEGTKKIKLYTWQATDPLLCGYSCEFHYTDRDECEANAIEKLTEGLQAEMEETPFDSLHWHDGDDFNDTYASYGDMTIYQAVDMRRLSNYWRIVKIKGEELIEEGYDDDDAMPSLKEAFNKLVESHQAT